MLSAWRNIMEEEKEFIYVRDQPINMNYKNQITKPKIWQVAKKFFNSHLGIRYHLFPGLNIGYKITVCDFKIHPALHIKKANVKCHSSAYHKGKRQMPFCNIFLTQNIKLWNGRKKTRARVVKWRGYLNCSFNHGKLQSERQLLREINRD